MSCNHQHLRPSSGLQTANVGNPVVTVNLNGIFKFTSQAANCGPTHIWLCEDLACTTLHSSLASLGTNPTLEDSLGFVKPVISLSTTNAASKKLYLVAGNESKTVGNVKVVQAEVKKCSITLTPNKSLKMSFSIEADTEVIVVSYFTAENDCIIDLPKIVYTSSSFPIAGGILKVTPTPGMSEEVVVKAKEAKGSEASITL
jgi:hypothetical protein